MCHNETLVGRWEGVAWGRLQKVADGLPGWFRSLAAVCSFPRLIWTR